MNKQNDTQKRIRLNLASVLDEMKITQAEAARKTGIHKNIISDMCRGGTAGIQFKSLEKLCRGLKVNIDQLIVFGD